MTLIRAVAAAFFLLLCPVVTVTAFAQSTAAVDTAEIVNEDAALAKRVRSALSQIPAFKHVFVSANGGVVSLRGTVLELEDVGRAAELVAKIDGVVTVNNLLKVETSIEERVTPALERFQKRVQQVIAVLPLFGIGLVIFGAVSAIGVLLGRLKNPWDAISPNGFIANLLRHFVRLAFMLLGLVLALDVMGATALLGTILGAAGILGLAIGFAVRDTVENYIASILLSFRQPFRPKDYVQIGSYEGYVIALTSRATILLTVDGNHVRIPNATVFKGEIINYSLNPERRFEFRIGVETDDLQRAVALGLEVINSLSFVLDEPDADGWIDGIGDSSMTLWFGGWINQNEASLVKAKSEAIRKVKLAFENEGIGLPEPIYRLRFDEAESLSKLRGTRPKSKGTSKPGPKIDDVEQDVSPDRQIERRVAKETRHNPNDLLDAEAPQEVESAQK